MRTLWSLRSRKYFRITLALNSDALFVQDRDMFELEEDDEGEMSEFVGEDKLEHDALMEWLAVLEDDDEDVDVTAAAVTAALTAAAAPKADSALLKLYKLFRLIADWKCGNEDDKK